MAASKNKVAKKKLFGFTSEALKELARRKREGVTETQALHDALLGRTKFNPIVEEAISAFQQKYDCSRDKSIEGLIFEAVRLKARQ